MGGCCSKCDKYLLGGPKETKGGDTPKLARVSHSNSFGKGEKGEVTQNPRSSDTPNNLSNGRAEEKQPKGGHLAEEKQPKGGPLVEKEVESKLKTIEEKNEKNGSTPANSAVETQDTHTPVNPEKRIKPSAETTEKLESSKTSVSVVQKTVKHMTETSGTTEAVETKSELLNKQETSQLSVVEESCVQQRSVETSSKTVSSKVHMSSSEVMKSSMMTSANEVSAVKMDSDVAPTHMALPAEFLTEVLEGKLMGETRSVVQETSSVQSSTIVHKSVESSSIQESFSRSENLDLRAISPSDIELLNKSPLAPSSADLAESSSLVESSATSESVQLIESSSAIVSSKTIKSSTAVESSKTVQSCTSVESSTLNSSESVSHIQSGKAVESSTVEESSTLESLSSSTLQSSSTQKSSSILQSSSTVKSLSVQESCIKESSASDTFLMDASSLMGAEAVGLEDKFKSLLFDKLDGAIMEGLEGIESTSSQQRFSSSTTETVNKASSVTTSSSDGATPVSKVEVAESVASSSSSSAQTKVGGEVVSSEEKAESTREEKLVSVLSKGDQVEEHSAILFESSGVELKDGEVVTSHNTSSLSETSAPPPASLEAENTEVDEDLPPPPPPIVDDFPPPPPEDDLPLPEDLESPASPKSGYVALVTPSGFVSPTRDENDANRRNFAKSLLTEGEEKDTEEQSG